MPVKEFFSKKPWLKIFRADNTFCRGKITFPENTKGIKFWLFWTTDGSMRLQIVGSDNPRAVSAIAGEADGMPDIKWTESGFWSASTIYVWEKDITKLRALHESLQDISSRNGRVRNVHLFS